MWHGGVGQRQEIDGVLGHPPVGGELSADHRHDAARAAGDEMAPGEIRGAGALVLAVGGDQWPQPGEAADDLLARDRASHPVRDGPEQEVDLGVFGVGDVVDLRDRVVGEADDHEPVAMRDGEDVVILLARNGEHHSCRGSAERSGPQHDVGALRRAQRRDRAAVGVLAGQRARPDAGRVDDRARVNGQLLSVSSSRSRAESPVAPTARTRVRIRAP